MTLIDTAYEDFTIINFSQVDDGYGGIARMWTDGATIKGVMRYDSSTQMKVAQAMGVTAAYTFIVKKNIALDFHTVLRRESDKKIFRLTNNADDMKTPNTAGLNMREYSAEEWKLT